MGRQLAGARWRQEGGSTSVAVNGQGVAASDGQEGGGRHLVGWLRWQRPPGHCQW